MTKDEPIEQTTCFKEHEKHCVSCVNKECKYWIENEDSHNCTMILAGKGPRTLQEIGDIFGVTIANG